MDSKKILVIVIAAIVVIGGVTAVVVSNNNNNDKEKETISIAYLNLGYYPFMVGFEKGYFDNLDFNVKPIVVTGSGQDAVNAVLAGDATMAATGDAPFINTLGKYPDKLVGLTQYTQSSGSLAGHIWIANNSLKGSLDAIEKDADGVVSNSATTAAQIKEITANKEGSGKDGTFSIGVINGSTTHTNIRKWCLSNDLTYDEGALEDSLKTGVDVHIIQVPKGSDAGVLITYLEKVDALATNKTLNGNIMSAIGDKVYAFGDSSALSGTSYSVLCTTQANYDKYKDQMIQVLEVLKEIEEWIKNNVEEASKICADLSNDKAETIAKNINGANYKVIWDTNEKNYDSWVQTAKINGYDISVETFINACPCKDTINAWYAKA